MKISTMKKPLIFLAFLFISPAFVCCQSQSDTSSERQVVKIDFNQTAQTIEGWGSSLCWWAGQVGKWDESKIDSVIDLITSPKELNMNIFRYNIGGGDDPSHIDGHMVKGKGKRAEMEGFKASANSSYNWDADKAQRLIMLKIKEKRPGAVFEAFSNSPPYWMTYSGCSAGNEDPKKDNLKPEFYEAFCDYLVDICVHYKNEFGIEFKTLEPFNESTSAYWNYLGSQEGCHFDADTQIKIIRLLYTKLRASGLKTIISASDETNVLSAINVLKAYKNAGDILDKIGQINTHTYSATNNERIDLHKLVVNTGKDFWQSETGPQGLPRRARGLENNLLLAQKMFDDLNLMKPQAWLDWQLLEENSDVWSLIKCDFKTEDFEPVKNFYVRKQVTRFVKQGYTFIETGNEKVLAAISPDKKELVIALNNSDRTGESFQLNLETIAGKVQEAEVYRTSNDENCSKLLSLKIKNSAMEYEAPELSLTTFVIQLN